MKDINQYLKRIHYNGSLLPNLENLTALQQAHLYNVAFENLDIKNGVPIKLDIDEIYNKIVCNNRGGFCYELNGLFYYLLLELGFVVKMVSARVYAGNNQYGEEFDHLTLLVTLNNSHYLVDVGFGTFAVRPLQLIENVQQEDKEGIFILNKIEQNWLVQKRQDNENKPVYMFNRQPRQFSDFVEKCIYHQTSTQSFFTREYFVNLPIPTGRLSLYKDTLKITDNGEIRELNIQNEDMFRHYLKQYFNITVISE